MEATGVSVALAHTCHTARHGTPGDLNINTALLDVAVIENRVRFVITMKGVKNE
jgi:hypothetical protein